MNFCLVLLATLIAFTQANGEGSSEWEKFKTDFGKVYRNAMEHDKRYNVFKKNLQYINDHNKLYEAGQSTFSLKVNEFADMTDEEFATRFNGLSIKGVVNHGDTDQYQPTTRNLPSHVDWRNEGYVTPVKRQGGVCGSCWAFSATGAMEGAHAKKTGNLVSLSEQNLVDCDKKSYGCHGGYMFNAFDYVINNKGIDTEESYPYEEKDGSCRFNKQNVGATFSSYKNISSGNEKDLMAAIASEGPVSVAIDAGHVSFGLYRDGIYDEPACGNDFSSLNHGVLAVGYGSEDGQDYYIVKNSWTEIWGDKGYIKMSRNKNNQCGIATAASFPVV